MKRNAVLAVRREVNHLRRGGLSDAQIAAALTRLGITAPSGASWKRAGIEARWTATGVTRFMATTRHVHATARPMAAAAARRPGAVTGQASPPRSPGFIRCTPPND